MYLESGKSILFIEERLVNEGGEPVDLMWGHHIAFGLPFLEGGAVIDAPARRLLVDEAMPGFEPRLLKAGQDATWPIAEGSGGKPVDMSRIPPQGQTGYREMAYLTDFSAGWIALTNPGRQVGFGLRFDPDHFRYVWLWEELGAGTGYPWWKRWYAVALEPWTSYPTSGLLEAIARGTQLTLAPDQEVEAWLQAIAYDGISGVSHITASGQVMGRGQ